jgi:hypothetical protein
MPPLRCAPVDMTEGDAPVDMTEQDTSLQKKRSNPDTVSGLLRRFANDAGHEDYPPIVDCRLSVI